MAYVTGYDYDVFVSYAWVNNQPTGPNDHDSGWVSQFRHKLQVGLDEKLGRIGSAKFFFDKAGISKSRDFNPQIESALKRTATLVAFYSPGYLASPACLQEMRLFNQFTGAARETGRVFLVPIDDVPDDDWPNDIRQLLKNVVGYHFFRKDEELELSLRLKWDDYQFLLEFERLRKAISARLKELKQQAETPAASSDMSDRPTVLITRTTPDLRSLQKQLRSHCESAGLRVLPEGVYSANPERFREEYQKDLKQTDAVVQLLSVWSSDATDEFPKGIEAYQYEQATKADCTLLRWRDDDLDLAKIDSDRYRQFITAPDVRCDLPALFFQAVARTAQENFKIARDEIREGIGGGSPRIVLVRADDVDAEPTREMVDRLSAANIRCRVTRNGVPMEDRLRRTTFDGLVIVLGECDPVWVDHQGDELLIVDLNLKDHSPVRAFCHHRQRRIVTPYAGKGILDLVIPDELDRLIEGLRQSEGEA